MSFIHSIYLQRIATAKKNKSKRLDLSEYYYYRPYPLYEIPDAVQELSSLEELILTNNQLETLPTWLKTLPNLKMVDVRQNPLKEPCLMPK